MVQRFSLMVSVLCAALVCILGCGGLGGGPVEMTEADRQVPFTVYELAKRFDIEVDPSRESMEMEREFDGSYSINYVHDQSDNDEVLYLHVLLAREASAKDAVTTYGVFKTVIAAQFLGEELERPDRPELCSLGDLCSCNGLVNVVAEVGTQCFIVDGSNVAMVQMIGAMWSEPGEVDAALGPMLERMKAWNPTQRPE